MFVKYFLSKNIKYFLKSEKTEDLCRYRLENRKKPAAFAAGFQSACYRAALAFSTRAVKAAASETASSASILRLSSMPAFFRPFMKRL